MRYLLPLLLCTIFYVNCSDLPCMKSYKYHLKANFAPTAAEKEYWERQAVIYDKQCAEFNEESFKKKQAEESRSHR
jgi:hypothetical protein